jgi:hypothetical protein
VPLSEHEQRILAELEESLVRHDPAFAERVRTKTLRNHAGTQCKWSALTFVAGLAILIAFYAQSVAAGLVGIAIMFASAVVFERNFRRLGKSPRLDLSRARLGGRDKQGAQGAVRGRADWLRARLFRRGR